MSLINRVARSSNFDFGLAVRAHPDSLLVTARNKMRTAAEVTRVISLSSQSFESVELPTSTRDLKTNSTLARETQLIYDLFKRNAGGVVFFFLCCP